MLSGLLAQYVGAPTRTVFVVDVALQALAAAALAVTAVEPVPAPAWTAFRPRLSVGLPPAVRGAFVLASFAAFGAFALMGVVAALGPTYVALLLHEHNRAVGGLVVFLLLAFSAGSQIAARDSALPRLFVAGPLLLVLGLTLIVLAKPIGSVFALGLGTCLSGVGQGLSYVAGQRLLDAHVDPQDRAGAFSAFFIVLYVGTALGALGVGLLTSPLGFFPAVVAVAFVVVALAVVTVVASRHTRLLATYPGG